MTGISEFLHFNIVIISKNVYNDVYGGDFTVTDKTMTFRIGDEKEDVMKDTLTQVFDATHNNARSLIRRIDRDELLAAMVKSYLD